MDTKYIANDSVFTAEEFARMQAMTSEEFERYIENMRNIQE